MAEGEFEDQLKRDVMLQNVFEIVVNDEERPINMPWFQSAIMTTRRAYSNRFDMVCLMSRLAKEVTNVEDAHLDVIIEEIDHLITLTEQFENEDGVFKLFKEKLEHEILEFIKWRTTTRTGRI